MAKAWVIFAAPFMALGAALFSGAALTPPAPTTIATQPRARDWPGLLKRLGDPDFKVRDAARRELDQVDYHQRGLLIELAAKADDAEVRDSLDARIHAIDEQLALNPLPISLDLENAGLSQLNKAMGDALGMSFSAGDWWDDPKVRFTIHAKDKPFWEIFEQLSGQHGLELSDLYAPELMHFDPGVRHFQQFGPAIVLPTFIKYAEGIGFQQNGSRDPGESKVDFYLGMEVFIDPRVPVASLSDPRILRVVDDAGNVLVSSDAANVTSDTAVASHSSHGTVDLKIPENPGTRIAELEGELQYQVIVETESFEVPDLQSLVGKVAIYGGATVKFDRINILPDELSIGVSTKSALGDDVPLKLSVFDADNKAVLVDMISSSTMTSIEQAARAPLHATLTVPQKVKTVRANFKFTDLPLPKIGNVRK